MQLGSVTRQKSVAANPVCYLHTESHQPIIEPRRPLSELYHGFIREDRAMISTVHVAEFHYLEALAKAGAYEFCYICTTAKIKGTTAGFALRPIAMR